MEVWREWTGREAVIRRAHAEMSNLASSLRQHADDTFQIAEVVLAGAVRQFEVDGFDPVSIARAAGTMQAPGTIPARIQGLHVFDAAGNWVVNSAGVYPPGANNADRSYFQFHRLNPDRSAHFTASLKSRVDNTEVMVISRRIDGPDGTFAGVAAVAFSAKAFADYYRTFEVGQDGAITLLHGNGQIISRMPYNEQVVGTDVSTSPFFKQAGGQRPDSFRFTSPVDSIERLGGYSASERYPIMVMASQSEREATAEWLQSTIMRGLVAFGVLALAGILGLRLVEQIRKRRASEVALLTKEAEFRMLAEHSNDLVERFTVDGIRQYASPAAYNLFGWEPGELIGKSAFDLIVPEDLPAAVAATDRMRRHTSLQETLTCRVRRKDGHVIWVEASLRLVIDESGKEVGVIINTRDATKRKEAELRLAAIASSDGLTGLQNRRAFDLALKEAVARAGRSGSPLSLLLLDVDRFKLFNDEYGHMAGDSCLRSIAAVLNMAARRDDDVAARYGGEELVLLLPDTNLAAATFIAGELCRQIEALRIPHELNQPWQVATVSAGVASIEFRPGEPERDGDWLISTADMALYQAKGEGRNRAKAAPREITEFEREAG